MSLIFCEKIMIKNTRTYLLFLSICLTGQAFGQSIEEVVYQTFHTNPDFHAFVEGYQASKADVDLAKSQFFPSIDLTADTGPEHINFKKSGTETDETRKQAKLQLTLPLFRGFSNQQGLKRSKDLMQAAYYESMAEAEVITLKVIKSYLDVMRTREVQKMSLDNLEYHHKTFDQINSREQRGVSDGADLSQIRGRLARAKAELTTARNNLNDAETEYVQLTGQFPAELIKPIVDTRYIPESVAEAKAFALSNSQSLLASKMTLSSAKAASKSEQSDYYPQLDLVADKIWKDNVEGSAGREDEWRVLVQMNWNLFGGGKTSSLRQKAIHNEQRSRMQSNATLRKVIANVDSSWNAYKTLQQNLIYYRDYVTETQKTQLLYTDQFTVGRRTLLDLLNSQNELFQARNNYLSNEYNFLYAQYRVISSMSYILDAMNINVMEGITNE